MDNQKEQRVTISFRVPVLVRNKIEAMAQDGYRPLSSEVERLMMKGMEALYGEDAEQESA